MKVFGAIFNFTRSVIATRGRLFALSAIGLVGALIALAIGASNPTEPLRNATLFIAGYGMTLMVPVVSLVFATAALGNLVEDNSLVYLWMRPTKRSVVAFSATTATWFVTVPVVVIPLVFAAFLAGGGPQLAVATVISGTLGVMAYGSIFVALGLRFQRALRWGFIYVLIWEGSVARSATGASRLSIQTYVNSILSRSVNVRLVGADIGLTSALVVVLALAGLGVGVTTWLLNHRDVA